MGLIPAATVAGTVGATAGTAAAVATPSIATTIGTVMATAAPIIQAAGTLAGVGLGIHSATQDAPKTPKPQTPLEDPRIAAQKQQDERRRRAAAGGRQSTIKSTPLGRSGGGASYGAAPKAQGARKILTG